MNDPKSDISEILEAIQILFPAGSLVELRIPKSKIGNIVGFFKDQTKLAEAVAEYSGNVAAVYYTLNEPSLELWEKNSHDKAIIGGHATSDAAIVRRNWLLIDCDPIRVDADIKPLTDQKVSSTDSEKQASREVAKNVNAYLADKGWPTPLSADSGNGYHLLYNLGGMESTKELTQIIKDVLLHLASAFNTDTVKIDASVHNASRITKAYGSIASKGEPTEDRPHRKSALINKKCGGAVSLKQLNEILPTPKKASIIIKANQTSGAATSATMEGKIDEFLEFYNLDHQLKTQYNGGWKWILSECPFNSDHCNGEVAVFIGEDGAYGFHCFHNSCVENTWIPFRQFLETKFDKKFFFQSNAQQIVPPDAPTKSKLMMERASSIKPEVLNWLWPNRIPFGKMTLFVGHPGIGKGCATMYIAARASNGTGWPDCPNLNGPIESLIISSEDAAGDTLVPRLNVAGADTSKIFIHRMTKTESGEKAFSIDTDLPALRMALEENPNLKLIIIDPVMNHLGNLNGNTEQELRNGLTPLGKLAEQFGAAIILVTHFNKSITSEGIQRVGGAMAMVGAVRVAWTFQESKDNGQRMMVPLKANVTKDNGGLAYKIVSANDEIDGQPVSVGLIEWDEDIIQEKAEDLLKQSQNNPPNTKIIQAMNWLKEFLKDGQPREAGHVKAAALELGFTDSTLTAAYKKIPNAVPSEKGKGANAAWLWQVKI